ncbi:MgtC/SapB family protein [Arcticibacter sp. MXS-1]|uniref:MgtC/SapB family protein n=1 Tax=Arcticibacter sp. MXS-1 TaxID=3341726 RepID=UPI0035A885C0
MIEWSEIVIRLSLAALFGAIIGLERERKNWAAGLRTHMLVCVGSALTMMVSAYGFMDVLGTKNVVLDPSRIAAQVISGIGFIGAGTILFLRQGIVRGLTTAAGLWTVAAIGLATGGGMYFAASIATTLAIIILFILQPFEIDIPTKVHQHSAAKYTTYFGGKNTLNKQYSYRKI